MIELIMDYVWSNKYILGMLGILSMQNAWQFWNLRKTKKQIKSLQDWSQKLYAYLQE